MKVLSSVTPATCSHHPTAEAEWNSMTAHPAVHLQQHPTHLPVTNPTATKRRPLYLEPLPTKPLPITHHQHPQPSPMASKAKAAVTAAATAVSPKGPGAGGYRNRWREKLERYKDELAKGVWGYWDLGHWKPLAISARHRAKIRREVLLAGEEWPYDPPRKEMRNVRKGHKCDRIAAQKRANTEELMKKMPQMLLDYKKRRWEKKMKAEEGKE